MFNVNGYFLFCLQAVVVRVKVTVTFLIRVVVTAAVAVHYVQITKAAVVSEAPRSRAPNRPHVNAVKNVVTVTVTMVAAIDPKRNVVAKRDRLRKRLRKKPQPKKKKAYRLNKSHVSFQRQRFQQVNQRVTVAVEGVS